MDITLATGLSLSLPHYTGFKGDIIDNTVGPLTPRENDYVLITPEVMKHLLKRYKTHTGMFLDVFPDDGDIIPHLESYIREEYVAPEEMDKLTQFLERNSLPKAPEPLLLALGKMVLDARKSPERMVRNLLRGVCTSTIFELNTEQFRRVLKGLGECANLKDSYTSRALAVAALLHGIVIYAFKEQVLILEQEGDILHDNKDIYIRVEKSYV